MGDKKKDNSEKRIVHARWMDMSTSKWCVVRVLPDGSQVTIWPEQQPEVTSQDSDTKNALEAREPGTELQPVVLPGSTVPLPVEPVQTNKPDDSIDSPSFEKPGLLTRIIKIQEKTRETVPTHIPVVTAQNQHFGQPLNVYQDFEDKSFKKSFKKLSKQPDASSSHMDPKHHTESSRSLLPHAVVRQEDEPSANVNKKLDVSFTGKNTTTVEEYIALEAGSLSPEGSPKSAVNASKNDKASRGPISSDRKTIDETWRPRQRPPHSMPPEYYADANAYFDRGSLSPAVLNNRRKVDELKALHSAESKPAPVTPTTRMTAAILGTQMSPLGTKASPISLLDSDIGSVYNPIDLSDSCDEMPARMRLPASTSQTPRY
ncbi:hypothetical protein EDC01DRAFT_232181 [Geopyxis carbonaria]|nr:hypothetical protein EDC01DRAFT_232181 [Geopyxis carbonaria]